MQVTWSGRVAFTLATAAVLWAAAFTWWALTASTYSDGQTILEANGEAIVRIAIAAPLVVSVIAWTALSIACHTDSRAAAGLGLGCASLLALFALVTGFTVGSAVMPGAGALLVAAVLVGRRR